MAVVIRRTGAATASWGQLEGAVETVEHLLVPDLEGLAFPAVAGAVELAATAAFAKSIELAGEPAVGVEVVGH